MKRILTLVGAIMGIVYSAIFTPLVIIGAGVLWAFLNNVSFLVIVIAALLVSVGVTALILDIIALRSYSCSAEQYAKNRKLLVSASVFSFVPSSIVPFAILTEFFELYLVIPVMILGVASGVLIAVDLFLEKNKAS